MKKTRKHKTVREQMRDMGFEPLTVGRAIRALRMAQEMTLSELALKLKKTSKQHLSDIENGRRSINPIKLDEISRALGEDESGLRTIYVKQYFDDEDYEVSITKRNKKAS